MKKNLNSLLAAFGFAVLVTFMASCGGDKCADVDCGTNGSCLEGDCNCNAGYEGTQCQTLSRAKFVYDSWNVKENPCVRDSCGKVVVPSCPDFVSAIKSGDGVDGILITNFGNYGNAVQVKGTVLKDNITLIETIIGAGTANPATANGNGKINADGTVTINYTIKQGLNGCDKLTAVDTYKK